MRLKYPKLKLAGFAFALLTVITAPVASATTTVVYPRPESTTDSRAQYPVKLLEMALRRSGGQYNVEPSSVAMLQARALMQLGDNSGVDVVWTTPSPTRDSGLQRIPIPIEKGLIGWRLLLIKKERSNDFTQLKDDNALRKMTGGQGHDWPDTDILRANQFRIKEIVGYEPLFDALDQGAIDYFPRSVMEIWAEVDAHRKQNVVIEPSVALHYPNAFYFYVSKSNSKLAGDIKLGLEKMIADGALDKLFHEYFDEDLKRSNLKSRHIIEMQNPLFPNDELNKRAELWFHQ